MALATSRQQSDCMAVISLTCLCTEALVRKIWVSIFLDFKELSLDKKSIGQMANNPAHLRNAVSTQSDYRWQVRLSFCLPPRDHIFLQTKRELATRSKRGRQPGHPVKPGKTPVKPGPSRRPVTTERLLPPDKLSAQLKERRGCHFEQIQNQIN